MRWAWAAVSLGLVWGLMACDEKPAAASDPLPVPKVAPPPPPVAAPPPPPRVLDKPAGARACGWGQVHEGEGVTYALTEDRNSHAAVSRVGGDIVETHKTPPKAGGTFSLEVVSRRADRAWARVAFDGVALPAGLPRTFFLEVRTGEAVAPAAPWQPGGDLRRTSQLTVDGATMGCEEFLVDEQQHTCIQPAPTCLYWLDGLVRTYERQAWAAHPMAPTDWGLRTLALTARTPAADADQGKLPQPTEQQQFAGTWSSRPGPDELLLTRYFLQAGQLVRESQHHRLVRRGPGHEPGLVALDNAQWAPDGAPTRETTSFRQWVLDLVGGKPVSPRFIPATAEPTTTFVSFPE